MFLNDARIDERLGVGDRSIDVSEVDPALGVVDPQATVSGRQRNLGVDLVVETTIPGDILRHRLGLLAGGAWELRNVR